MAALKRAKSRTKRLRQRGGSRRHVSTKKLPMPGPSQCHPSLGKETPMQGCIPVDVLHRVRNQLHISNNLNDIQLRKEIETRLNSPPGAERTFLYKLPIAEQEKADIARRYLRPAMPSTWKSDPDMWLDSNNISAVMNQYEDAYPYFEFMGPFPVDFAAPDPYQKAGGQPKCLMNEICELRVTQALANGTKSIGVVYNLDPHFKSGSHWVATYIDIVGHKCYYFDSYGMAPPQQIARFMKWLTTQDPKMSLFYGSRRLQFNNTECGIYCMYFIIRMLEGDKFLEITRRKPSDSDMLDLRDWLFST
jgi:hypothetical protein